MRPCSLKWPPISEYISLDELVLGDWLGAATACGDCCGMAAPFGCSYSTFCCETATLRQVEFYVDPENPRQMVDGSGRTIRYLGVLYMSLCQHEHRRALSLSGQEGPGGEWVIL